jgi:Zn-dependent peptidase ImmA (M78 family)/DNA-binding XRE family transcriptional regulator
MTFNHDMLTLAKDAAGLTQSAIAEHAGVSQSMMSKIENGFDQPSADFVRRAAEITGMPPDFFALAEPIVPDTIFDIFHKKRLTLPMKPLRKANAKAQMIRLQITRLFRTYDVPVMFPFPYLPIDVHDSPAEVADLTRSAWHVPLGPFRGLVEAVEATGTPVVLADLEHEKLRAMCLPGARSYGAHIIVLNSRLPASAQRFALAHEIGHLVMHQGVATPNMEKEADDFAAALLMPAAHIAPRLRNLRFRDLGALKATWRVSLAALIYRARELGMVTDRHYRTLNMELNKLPNGRKREPGEFPREEPQLVERVINGYFGQGYTMSDVANLMVVREDDLRRSYLHEPPADGHLRLIKT